MNMVIQVIINSNTVTLYINNCSSWIKIINKHNLLAQPIALVNQTSLCLFKDVVGLLEKRVKSRFSHRQLHLLGNLDFDGYVDIFRMLLTLPEDFIDRKYAKKWLQTLEVNWKSQSLAEFYSWIA